jgi:Holliday junction resolvase RusA-like endonuclease
VKFQFVIEGPPKTKKNSMRIFRNKKTGAPFITQSAQQKVWARDAVQQLCTQWKQTPIEHDVNMRAVIYRERATGDLLNYLAAVSDALEAAGVIVNDKQVVSVDGSRMDKDAKRPRVEVEIEVLECA